MKTKVDLIVLLLQSGWTVDEIKAVLEPIEAVEQQPVIIQPYPCPYPVYPMYPTWHVPSVWWPGPADVPPYTTTWGTSLAIVEAGE